MCYEDSCLSSNRYRIMVTRHYLMKQSAIKLLLSCAIAICLFIQNAQAQGQFKAGLGAAVVSNQGDHPAFNAFLAPSLHLGYAISLTPVLKLGVENYLVVRLKEKEYTRRDGFAVALPVTLELRLPLVSFYTGAGPAYASQRVQNDDQWGTQRVRGQYADIMGGVGFRKRNIANILTMEYSLRFHYLKNFSSTREDGAMLSFVVAIGGAGQQK